MKRLWLALLPFVLLACSSKGVQQMPVTSNGAEAKDSTSSVAESTFQESSGSFKLTYDSKGHWLKITARSFAGLTQDGPAAKDSALMIATMRAKRTVTEFLHSDVKSAKTLIRLGKSYANHFQSAEDRDDPSSQDSDGSLNDGEGRNSEQSRQAKRFAESLSERIQDNSAAIIKGGYVSYHAFEDGRAVVELTVTRESIGAARSLSRMMAGALQ